MNLVEAVRQALANPTKMRVTRDSWWYATESPNGPPIRIEPTNSPCKCILWIADKEKSISEWTPMLDDLIADDWSVVF